MLHTSQLKNLFKWKYFFLVPIVGLVLTFSSCGNDKSDADQDKVTLEENEKNDKEDKYEGTPEKSMKASKAQNLKNQKTYLLQRQLLLILAVKEMQTA